MSDQPNFEQALAALTAATLVPVGAYFLGETRFAVATLFVLSLLVFWTHRTNLARLARGTEPKTGQKKKDAG